MKDENETDKPNGETTAQTEPPRCAYCDRVPDPSLHFRLTFICPATHEHDYVILVLIQAIAHLPREIVEQLTADAPGVPGVSVAPTKPETLN